MSSEDNRSTETVNLLREARALLYDASAQSGEYQITNWMGKAQALVKAIDAWQDQKPKQEIIATFSPCCEMLREGECKPGIMHNGLCMCEGGPTIYLVEAFRIPPKERS